MARHAFHGDYKMTAPQNTSAEMLRRAVDIGRPAGLHYIYAGNLPGRVGNLEDTRCPQCAEVLIERRGYLIRRYNLSPVGGCPSCGTQIPGRWDETFAEQRTSLPFRPAELDRIR